MRNPQNTKGVTLIIVIFGMMLLGIMGWSLSVMQSMDLEVSLRQVDFEQALYLAEAGAQWALNQLDNDQSWREVGGESHILSRGEYNVVCRDGQPGEDADAIIISTGYVSSQADYRVMRQIRLTVEIGDVDEGAAQIKYLLDWHLWHTGSEIRGDINVGFEIPGDYNGDGDAILSEYGQDYGETPVIPETKGARIRSISSYAGIDLNWFYIQPGVSRWEPPVSRTAMISSVSIESSNELRIAVTPGIFTNPAPLDLGGSDWVDKVIVRNQRNDADTLADRWGYHNWGVINTRVSSNEVILEFDASVDMYSGTDIYGIPYVWQNNQQVTIGKRFYHKDQKFAIPNLWYIKGDVLFDLRDGNDQLKNIDKTGFIVEGDTTIRGDGSIDIASKIGNTNYPNIATKHGNIFSPDTPSPSPNTENKKRDARHFDGLLYTQFGDIYFNYLDSLAVGGSRVYLDGLVLLRFEPGPGKAKVDPWGFEEGLLVTSWQEE